MSILGDAAVRELSEKFDRWSPTSFRLAPIEVEEIIANVPEQVITDIQFAQAQVRTFAERRRTSLRDIEVETLPGVVLGHKHIPVNSVGCYIPGGRYKRDCLLTKSSNHGGSGSLAQSECAVLL